MINSILIVDDEESTLDIMRSDLVNAGYQVDVSSSGEEAIRKFNDNGYDLMVIDLIMEGMDGIQVARAVKQSKPETKVIILTGYGSQSTAIDALRMGVSDYFLKPYDRKDFLNTVENCLGEFNKTQNSSANIDIRLKQFGLTSREIEVVYLITKGNTAKEISEILFVCYETAKGHMKNIHSKLGVHNRAQLLSKIKND